VDLFRPSILYSGGERYLGAKSPVGTNRIGICARIVTPGSPSQRATILVLHIGRRIPPHNDNYNNNTSSGRTRQTEYNKEKERERERNLKLIKRGKMGKEGGRERI
jgi:hypothetical protein